MSTPTYRAGTPDDDDAVIEHYLAIWKSYGVPDHHFSENARDSVAAFLAASRVASEGGVVIAERGGRVVGSVGYERQAPQFPEVLKRDVRKVGYIWSVYVDPAERGHGIATAMVVLAVERLKSIGCTMIALHASEAGAPVYAKLGFELGHEMRLKP